MGGNNITFDCEKSVTGSVLGKIYDAEKSVSYPMIPNSHVSYVDGNEHCYNRGRCRWVVTYRAKT